MKLVFKRRNAKKSETVLKIDVTRGCSVHNRVETFRSRVNADYCVTLFAGVIFLFFLRN